MSGKHEYQWPDGSFHEEQYTPAPDQPEKLHPYVKMEAGVTTSEPKCGKRVSWWEGEYEGDCQLALDHDGGAHFDGVVWFDDDGRELPGPPSVPEVLMRVRVQYNDDRGRVAAYGEETLTNLMTNFTLRLAGGSTILVSVIR